MPIFRFSPIIAIFTRCNLQLRKAHRANDAAVLEAYGFPKDANESDIVARLFKMYQELAK
ncbi:MAG: hypothetical protein K6G39_08360 [Bacteroidales bacterium]|nr:hypothetical protein [Bacteroidales bacterium]